MAKLNLLKWGAPLLCLSLSFQGFADPDGTPIHDRRVAENSRAVQEFKDVWKMFTFGATRASLGVATSHGGYINLSGLGLLMLPGALIFDAVCLVTAPLSVSVLAGNVAYTHLKNKFGESSDEQKLSDELKLFKINMHTRLGQIEKLIGDRYIRDQDRYALMLGFTLFHSLDLEDGFRLANGQIVRRSDFDVFPNPASLAYTSLDLAKYDAKRLMKQYLNHEASAQKELVERMTFENEQEASAPVDANRNKRDDLDMVIDRLRKAATSMNEVLCQLDFN